MPHINVNNDLPGIRGLMAFRPETAEPLGALAQVLLRDDEGISRAERELIATHVSYRNDCFYCHTSHGATDREIHDTVLIAAAFCMFNRYVDGLAAMTPTDLDSYDARGRQIAEKGYGKHIFSVAQPVNV
jgi:AhpD family alkylhydroperoxidase